MRMRKKVNLDSRWQRQEGRIIADPAAYRGRWLELLPEAEELRLELGCGKGKFTVQTAAKEPNVLFVAVERVPDAMIIAVERADALGLKNVFFIDADAARLTDFFAPAEVSRIYLNFSDPWPSARMAKRRLTYPDFLRLYHRVLAPEGQIHFKTDNSDLYEWSLFQFPKAGFHLSEVTRDLHANGPCGVMTDYEEKFYLQGKPINRCVATRGATLSARLKLVRPMPEHEAQVMAYREAMLAAESSLDGCSGLENVPNYETWLTQNAMGNVSGWVKADTFLTMDEEGQTVGMVNVRRELTEHLLQYGGHIGYSIHPNYRRRGYATEQLALALAYCRDELGLEKALVTCDDDNQGSIRTILHFDAELENKVEDEDGRLTRRYWVSLP